MATQVRGAAYWREWREAHPEYRERQKRNRQLADRQVKRRLCSCAECRCKSQVPAGGEQPLCGFCMQDVHEE